MKDERGFRIVAGCICVRQSNQSQVEEILLLSSRRRSGRWVLPKGGQEKGETGEQAAMRETWEEGGVRGKIIGQLRAFDDMEAGRNPTTFRFYVMQVEQVADDWPEAHERERLWVLADHALDKCDKHSMQQAISYYLKQYNK